MLSFAIDFGNGFVKAISEKRTIVAPSSIVEAKKLGKGSIDNLVALDNLGYQVYKSNLDDEEKYAWGEEVENIDGFTKTGITSDRYTDRDFKLLCEFVLAELGSDFTEEELQEVFLVTGMPSQEIGTPEEKTFYNHLKGKHLVERNNKEMVINIKELKIVEQPVGTLLDLYMTDEGKMHKSLKTDKVVVMDFGAGTTIIDTFQGLRRIEEESVVEYTGINDIYKSVVRNLQKNHNIKRDIFPLIKQGFEDGNYRMQRDGRDYIPFEEVAKEHVKDHLKMALRASRETVGGLDLVNQFILTGGGLNIIEDTFKESANDITKKIEVTYVEDAQKENVRGYYKLAKVLSEQ